MRAFCTVTLPVLLCAAFTWHANQQLRDELRALRAHEREPPSLSPVAPAAIAARLLLASAERPSLPTADRPPLLSTTKPDAPAEVTPSAAMREASRALAQTIARGAWRADDVRALTAQLATCNADEQLELRRQVAVALNNGQIVPEDPHFIFP